MQKCRVQATNKARSHAIQTTDMRRKQKAEKDKNIQAFLYQAISPSYFDVNGKKYNKIMFNILNLIK